MNFSQAVRGQLKPSQAIIAINSQAETELRRSLSKEEEAFLFTNFPPNILLEKIQKVSKIFKNIMIDIAKESIIEIYSSLT